MQAKSGRHVSRNQRPQHVNSEGLNWVLIVVGAVLTTFAIKAGCKLKQVFTANRTTVDGPNDLKGASTLSSKEKSEAYGSNSDLYSFEQIEDECCRSFSGNGTEDMKQASDGPMSKVLESTLPLATIPAPEVARDRSWTSSAERLELSRRIFNSNRSESPCESECGSNAFSKKEILQNLRWQLKKRDEMILEMQAQITELHSLRTRLSKSAELQSQFDLINFEPFESEREAQRPRKAVADKCVGDMSSLEKLNPSEHLENGYLNGFLQGDSNLELHVIDVDKAQKESLDGYEMLKKEVVQLKEVIEGKEFLLQTYKEQLAELHFPIKELQPSHAKILSKYYKKKSLIERCE